MFHVDVCVCVRASFLFGERDIKTFIKRLHRFTYIKVHGFYTQKKKNK